MLHSEVEDPIVATEGSKVQPSHRHGVFVLRDYLTKELLKVKTAKISITMQIK